MTDQSGVMLVELATGRLGPSPDVWVKLSSGDLWRGFRLVHTVTGDHHEHDAFPVDHIICLLTKSDVNATRLRGGEQLPVKLDAGEIAILPSRVPSSLRIEGKVETLLIEMSPELLASAAGQNRSSSAELRPVMAVDDGFIARTILALHADLRAGAPQGPAYGESLGAALAAHLVRWYCEFVERPQHSARVPGALVDRVREFIEKNLDTDLSLQSLAHLVHMDVFAFSRSFKQAVGASPHRYIMSRRIDRAKELLAQPKLPIADIALRCGFSSQSSFSDAFRRLVKVTPRAYRNIAGK
jgi:AraC family transcriptional regulator